jgi:hypothetical protein
MATQKSQKLSPKFSCKTCDYNTSIKCEYKKHLLSAKHNSATIGNGLQPKVSEKFACEICDYNTSIKCDYKKHLLTLKHRNLTNSQENSQKEVESNDSSYLCEICLKKYITRSGLWRHKKKCSPNETKNEPPAENTMALTSSHIDNHLIIELIKQNGEILKQLAEINVHRCKIEQTRFSNSNENN